MDNYWIHLNQGAAEHVIIVANHSSIDIKKLQNISWIIACRYCVPPIVILEPLHHILLTLSMGDRLSKHAKIYFSLKTYFWFKKIKYFIKVNHIILYI